MTVDYRGLNKVTLPLPAAMHNTASLLAQMMNIQGCIILLFTLPMPSLASHWPLNAKTSLLSLGRGKNGHSLCSPRAIYTGHKLSWASSCGSGYVGPSLQCFPLPLHCWYHANLRVSFQPKRGQSPISGLMVQGWLRNSDKTQGPGLSVKYLGVIWSGRTKMVPWAVIDKVQAYVRPTTPKQLQTCLGHLGYRTTFTPHLAQTLWIPV